MTEYKIDFSIITICYNSINTIEKTIKSVIAQSYKNFEYIIIDGASTDGTIELINKYKDDIDVFVSEPDKGIYDAFNKGIKLAKGNYIGILNSDDTFNPNTLEIVTKETEKKSNSIIYGNTYFIDENDIVFSHNEGCFDVSNLKKGIGFMHPASFIHNSVYDKVGLYSLSENLNIAGDADFLIRCYKVNVPFVKCDFKVFMRTGGISETSFYLSHKQYLTALKNNDIINQKEYKFELLKLIMKVPMKKVMPRKRVANFKLQSWIILIALFNFILKYLPFFFLKNILLKIFKFKIGKSSYIHKSTFLSIGKFKLGHNSVINPNCIIDNRGKIDIGNNVSIGHFSKIYTTGHDIDCSYFSGLRKPVVIKDRAVLFSSCIIQPGVTIGEAAVVLPGSVVVKDVPDFTTVGGNPAKKIGERSPFLNYKIDYGFKFIK